MTADAGSFALAVLGALCIGLSKAGFSGISMISVLLFAEIYGARASTGMVLPMLIAADIMVYPAFRRYGSWRPVWPLLAPMFLGLAAGWWLLGKIDDEAARPVIGGVILLMVALETARRLRPGAFDHLTASPWFGHGAGTVGGFATMMANAAGPVIQLFLMSRRFPKMEMVGIGARLFLLVNLTKVPLSAGLSLITPASLIENARLLPAVIVGILGGKALLHRLPQRVFDWMVVVMAALAGLRLCCW